LPRSARHSVYRPSASIAAPLSTLDPAGPGRLRSPHLVGDVLGKLVIFAGVLALAVYPFLKSRNPAKRSDRPFLWGGGLAFPLVVLAALLAYALRAGPSHGDRANRDCFRVEVHAHQWWWEFVYPDAEGGPLYTAFALHVPAGERRRGMDQFRQRDPQFWVPRLGRKIDATPGSSMSITLQADTPGVYWGQCSEFCGMQHAAMAFTVEAHEPARFAARSPRLRRDARPDPSRRPTSPPTAPDATASIRAARGNGAPNLAGLADRRRLGSGAMAHRRLRI
jgi:cytochrome c oxidase subunit II